MRETGKFQKEVSARDTGMGCEGGMRAGAGADLGRALQMGYLRKEDAELGLLSRRNGEHTSPDGYRITVGTTEGQTGGQHVCRAESEPGVQGETVTAERRPAPRGSSAGSGEGTRRGQARPPRK